MKGITEEQRGSFKLTHINAKIPLGTLFLLLGDRGKTLDSKRSGEGAFWSSFTLRVT
jgi:hypothetical protein